MNEYREWVKMIQEAKALGLTPEEIRNFIASKKGSLLLGKKG